MGKYFKQYKWSNIFAMIKNQKKDPLICEKDCNGKLVVITGATSGIGYETALKFASKGANILSVNRNEQKSKALCETIKNDYGVKCSYLIADFSSLSDVTNVSIELSNLEEDIDILIHNAGTYVTKREVTKDNMEKVFQTNYLSTFIINYYLKEKFINQNKGRILFVNSEAHRFAPWGLKFNDLMWEKRRYKGIKGYGSAKMAQLLSMLKFNEYFANTIVTINAMHPGNVKTNSGSSNGRLYKWWKRNFVDRSARPISISSEALYYLGNSEEVSEISAKFFNLTTLEEPAPPALDMEAAEKLWQISLTLGGIQDE